MNEVRKVDRIALRFTPSFMFGLLALPKLRRKTRNMLMDPPAPLDHSVFLALPNQ